MSALPDDLQPLFDAARTAQANAYAPYSNWFRVGVAIRADDGRIYAGCNVENAAYDAIHAEDGAISAMIAGGGKRICDLVCVGPFETECTPCGKCRQKIREFSDAQTRVHTALPSGALFATYTIDELLPYSFGPENLSG